VHCLVTAAVPITIINTVITNHGIIQPFRTRESSRFNSDGVNVEAHFVLKTNPEKRANFEKQLLQLSTPSNAKYGQWLSKDQVKAQLAPSEDSVKKVVDFIKSYGLTDDKIKIGGIGGLTVRVTMPIKVANDMLQTDFGVFRSVMNRQAVIPRVTKPYYLPSHIADVVSLVDDIVRFPAVRKPLLSFGAEETSGDDPFSSCGTKCNGFTTPAVLEQAYKFGKVSSATKGNSVSGKKRFFFDMSMIRLNSI
jgi:tripeptidyl-peptidase-1